MNNAADAFNFFEIFLTGRPVGPQGKWEAGGSAPPMSCCVLVPRPHGSESKDAFYPAEGENQIEDTHTHAHAHRHTHTQEPGLHIYFFFFLRFLSAVY